MLKKFTHLLVATLCLFLLLYGADYWWGCEAQPDNSASTSAGNLVCIPDEGGAASAGNITKIQIYKATFGDCDMDVVVFSKAGDEFTDKFWTTIAVVGWQYHEYTDPGDFDKDDLPVAAGDYVGFFLSASHTMDATNAGGPSFWHAGAATIKDNDADTYTEDGGNKEVQFRVWVEEEAAEEENAIFFGINFLCFGWF